jgi:hypothetical protein
LEIDYHLYKFKNSRSVGTRCRWSVEQSNCEFKGRRQSIRRWKFLTQNKLYLYYNPYKNTKIYSKDTPKKKKKKKKKTKL